MAITVCKDPNNTFCGFDTVDVAEEWVEEAIKKVKRDLAKLNKSLARVDDEVQLSASKYDKLIKGVRKQIDDYMSEVIGGVEERCLAIEERVSLRIAELAEHECKIEKLLGVEARVAKSGVCGCSNGKAPKSGKSAKKATSRRSVLDGRK